jgi:hypothetical protein
MPYNVYQWIWEEAFYKFGFDDGDGLVMTYDVEEFITSLGYEVGLGSGTHNPIIISILVGGKQLLDDPTFNIGETDPREYLPKDLVDHLDAKFPREEIYATRKW